MTNRLRDIGLMLLAVATVAASAYVLTRSPGVTSVRALASPPTSSPPPAVRALFVGGDALLGASPGLAERAADALDWQLEVAASPGAGFVVRGADGNLAERAPGVLRAAQADVVVVVAASAPTDVADVRRYGGNVQSVVGAVRRALPDAAVVLVGPLDASPEAAPVQREVLTQVASRFGAYFVDVSGRGYLAAAPGLVQPGGSLTAAGAERAAAGLTTELREVLPGRLVPASADVNGG